MIRTAKKIKQSGRQWLRGPRRPGIWMKGSGQRLGGLERSEARIQSLQGGRRGEAEGSVCPASGAAGGRWEAGTSVRATAGQEPARKENPET